MTNKNTRTTNMNTRTTNMNTEATHMDREKRPNTQDKLTNTINMAQTCTLTTDMKNEVQHLHASPSPVAPPDPGTNPSETKILKLKN